MAAVDRAGAHPAERRRGGLVPQERPDRRVERRDQVGRPLAEPLLPARREPAGDVVGGAFALGGAGEGDPDPRGGPMFHLIPLLVLTFVLAACGGDPLPNVDDGGSPDITAPADARGDTSAPPDGHGAPDA